MKIDDPRLTAYALNELGPAERVEVEATLSTSPEARAYIEEIQSLAVSLREEYQSALPQAEPVPQQRNSLLFDSNWMSIRAAALIAICAVIAVLAISSLRREQAPLAKKGTNPIEMEDEEAAVAGFGNTTEFVSTANQATSILPLSSNVAAYEDVRRMVQTGLRPPKEKVKLEAFINHFQSDSPIGDGDSPVLLFTEVAGCPWSSDLRLVRIQLHLRRQIKARAVVTFRPAAVESYRLLGYDGGKGNYAKEEEEEEVPAGETLTYLYEMRVRTPEQQPLLTIKVISKAAGELLSETVVDQGRTFAEASPDFRLTAAAARFAVALRDEISGGKIDFDEMLRWTENGPSETVRQHEFAQLVARAKKLPP